MADGHGTKGMWVCRMLDPHCDFEVWPHPWPWPLIFKVKFWKSRNSGMGCPIDMEQKGCEATECWNQVATFNFDLTYDLDLEFSTSNFEIAVSREWGGRLTWNERDMSRWGVLPTLWPWAMTLTLDFQGQTLKMLYLRNGRANWHGTKGMLVHRMLNSHRDLELWPLPWPWPWIFKVNFLNSWISGIGGPTNMERKGYEWIGCYTNYVTFSYDFDLGFWRSNFKKALS